MILALLMLMGIWQPPLPPALGMAYTCIVIIHGNTDMEAARKLIEAAAETNCNDISMEQR